MSTTDTAPEFQKTAFNCPYCNAYAQFYWGILYVKEENSGHWGARCFHCNQYTIWVNSDGSYILAFPKKNLSPLPSPDMPKDCLLDYEEARSISAESPRAAAALLRLVIQKLCIHFGEPGENLNDDIKNLVKKGLDSRIQKALDIIRVTGNHSVHPGEMNTKDKPEITSKLFEVVNMIVHEMITKKKELESLYESLPEKDRTNIQNRDSGQNK